MSQLPPPNRIAGFYRRREQSPHGVAEATASCATPPDGTVPAAGMPVGERPHEIDEQVLRSAAEVQRAIRRECSCMAIGLALVLGAVPLALFAAASWLSTWWGLPFALSATVVASISLIVGGLVVVMAACGAARLVASFAESILRLRLNMLAMQHQLRQGKSVK